MPYPPRKAVSKELFLKSVDNRNESGLNCRVFYCQYYLQINKDSVFYIKGEPSRRISEHLAAPLGDFNMSELAKLRNIDSIGTVNDLSLNNANLSKETDSTFNIMLKNAIKNSK